MIGRGLPILLAWAILVTAPAAAQYDVLIRGARVYDGSGNPWYRTDVAVLGDVIAAVGDLEAATAARVIDAAGLYLAPGFIDTHSHAGPALATEDLSGAAPLLAQGVTTVVVNPDGGGAVDLRAQRRGLLEHGLGVNVAQFAPHGSIRREVLGMEDRVATAAELDRMRTLVREAMEAGAFGLSSGLYYAPGSYADLGEVIELARVAAAYGGVYQSHIRDEADYTIGVVAAVDEVITVAREAGLPGIVTHVKALGPRVWGKSAEIVDRMESARAAGVEVFADQYPYEASGTSITGALIPRWAQVGGDDSLMARFDDPRVWPRLREDILENFERRGGAEKLQIRRFSPDPALEGMRLAAIAEQRGIPPVDIVRELMRQGGASLVSFNMIDDDIELLMRQPWTMTASDGGLVRMGVGVPHPRYYGAFARKLRRYAIDGQVVTVENAIRSMTSLPAVVTRIRDRGTIRAGARADIAVFDLERVGDHSTYDDPHHLSEGMVYVLVNGRLAVDEGVVTGGRFGEVLRRN